MIVDPLESWDGFKVITIFDASAVLNSGTGGLYGFVAA